MSNHVVNIQETAAEEQYTAGDHGQFALRLSNLHDMGTDCKGLVVEFRMGDETQCLVDVETTALVALELGGHAAGRRFPLRPGAARPPS